jgi:hypothetical protein
MPIIVDLKKKFSTKGGMDKKAGEPDLLLSVPSVYSVVQILSAKTSDGRISLQ